MSKPKISDRAAIDDNIVRFTVEPLERGFGHTLGNSLRRILLSSLPGAAITQVKVDGVYQEFSRVEGLKEDIVDLVLNLKNIVIDYEGTGSAKLTLDVTGSKKVTAKDIKCPPDVKIINPETEIGTLSKNSKLSMELTVEKGRGYVAAERNKRIGDTIGTIPIDSDFCPVRRVSFDVENTRVGQRTDYNKLVLEIETKGSIAPDEALKEAARVLMEHAAIFDELEGEAEAASIFGPDVVFEQEYEDRDIDELKLSVRSRNCLKREGVNALSDLLAYTETDLLNIRNLGDGSLKEIRDKLAELGLSLREES